MRFQGFILACAVVCLYSCDGIPNKSVFLPLTSDELAPIIKKDTLFADFYEAVKEGVGSFNEIEKAKFNDITYRSLYKMEKFISDTSKVNPLQRQWEKEWEDQYGGYAEKVDSVLSYWTEYKAANSLDRFVKVEFAVVDKEYYSYSFDVKNVNLGFRLTPLQGPVDQLKFNYRYSAKIDDFYGDKHLCICTSPIKSSSVRYWEVDYSDEKRLKNVSTSEFIRDYDIAIEVTDVRKDGINYSIDDLHIPSSVREVWDTDKGKYPYLYEMRKEVIISDILCPSYKGEYSYISDKMGELLKNKFPRDYAFYEYMTDKY